MSDLPEETAGESTTIEHFFWGQIWRKHIPVVVLEE
jgi:hypothetical protein